MVQTSADICMHTQRATGVRTSQERDIMNEAGKGARGKGGGGEKREKNGFA